MEIRDAHLADAARLTELWLEGGREFEAVDHGRFQQPDEEGLVEFMRAGLAKERPESAWLVAVDGGRVVGDVGVRLLAPHPTARWQLLRDLATQRAYVDHLRVAASARRRGVARSLMDAAERWAASRGARSIALDTWARSPDSVPFYDAIGYERRGIIFEKRL